jgi:hypothetical protein
MIRFDRTRSVSNPENVGRPPFPYIGFVASLLAMTIP